MVTMFVCDLGWCELKGMIVVIILFVVIQRKNSHD